MSWGVAILYINFLNSSILLIVLLELLTIIFSSIKGANHKIIALSVDNISYLRPAGGEESGEEGGNGEVRGGTTTTTTTTPTPPPASLRETNPGPGT